MQAVPPLSGPLAGDAPTDVLPWERTDLAKPDGAEYGFFSSRGTLVTSTRERLVHLCAAVPPPLVWTPESGRLVPPWEVPYLLDAMRAAEVERARRDFRMVLVGAVVGLVLLAWRVSPLVPLVAAPFVAVVLAALGRRVERVEEFGDSDLRATVETTLRQRRLAAIATPFTRAVMASVALVALAQVLVGAEGSIEAAGADPRMIVEGEAWRLATAVLLHGGVWHFVMNYLALASLGRTMEAYAPRAWLPIVFLGSALVGSVASFLLPPHFPSVGASGGLLGLFGFLAVVGYRRRGHLPPGFLRAILIDVAFIAVLGAALFFLIDNAGHAGGLVAGALIGLVAVPDGERFPEWKGGERLRRAGWAALALVAVIAIAAAAVVLERVGHAGV